MNEFKLKRGKNRRYILYDVTTKKIPYTSIRHFSKVSGVSEYRIHKAINEFLDLGFKVNTKDRVTRTFIFGQYKVLITILNYTEYVK